MDQENPQNNLEANTKKKVDVEKLIGYLLLVTGLVLILVSLLFVFRALTGKMKVAQVFDVESPAISLPQLSGDLELNVPSGVKIIPDELLNGVVNIGLFYLLMMFVVSAGAKVSGIGVKMIKNIKVDPKKLI